MPTKDSAAAAAADEGLSRRELAVARSLDSARSRAEKRVQRFLDAAMELMNEGSGKEFTVQEVVERSGQSLRSFYQYFDGKHELLLAMFEESVRSTADSLRDKVAEEDEPIERVHRFVVEYHRMCRPLHKTRSGKKAPAAPTAPVLVDFAQQLLTGRPTEAARAFAPLVVLFREVLDDAARAGALRKGLDRDHVVGVVLETVMFSVFSTTIGGSTVDAGDAAEALWDLVFHGIGA